MTTTHHPARLDQKLELRSIADQLIVAANNPVSHGREEGLREIMLKQGNRIRAALAQPDAGVPSSWDEKALEVARKFTADDDPQTRAKLQCAVRDAMRFAAPRFADMADAFKHWDSVLMGRAEERINSYRCPVCKSVKSGFGNCVKCDAQPGTTRGDGWKRRVQLAIEHGNAHGWDVARNELMGLVASYVTTDTTRGDGLPKGWRVRQYTDSARLGLLLVTSPEGAEAIVGPQMWQHSVTSHVLYQLVQALTTPDTPAGEDEDSAASGWAVEDDAAPHKFDNTREWIEPVEMQIAAPAPSAPKGGAFAAFEENGALRLDVLEAMRAKGRAAKKPDGWVTLGVGDGSGELFVHGPYEAIKACQRQLLAASDPRINIKCVTDVGGMCGSTILHVIRVEKEDDGSFTAVTDYWPDPAAPRAEAVSDAMVERAWRAYWLDPNKDALSAMRDAIEAALAAGSQSEGGA